MRVAVAGTGAFGRNHLRVLRELETCGPGRNWSRPSSPTCRSAPKRPPHNTAFPFLLRLKSCSHADLSSMRPFVAVPPSSPRRGFELLDAGLDLLVEKPLAANSCRSRRSDRSIAAKESAFCSLATWSASIPRYWPWSRALRGPCSLRRTGSASSRRARSMWMLFST